MCGVECYYILLGITLLSVVLISMVLAVVAGRVYEKKLKASEPPLPVFVNKTGAVYHTLRTCSYMKSEHVRQYEMCSACKKGM